VLLFHIFGITTKRFSKPPQKNYKMKKLILVLIIAVSFYSCRKEVTEPAPANLPTTIEGTITGNLAQWDQYGTEYLSNLNTATVSINNTNYSTVTDATGNYTLTNVIPGTYNISYIKTGCGTVQRQQITFAGNGTYYLNASICDRATHVFNSGTFSKNGGNLDINLTLTPLTQRTGALLILGTTNANPDLSDPSSYSGINIFDIPANSSSHLEIHNLGNNPPGTIIYGRLYPFPYYVDGASYGDYQSNKTMWTAFGTPLSTFSVVM